MGSFGRVGSILVAVHVGVDGSSWWLRKMVNNHSLDVQLGVYLGYSHGKWLIEVS